MTPTPTPAASHTPAPSHATADAVKGGFRRALEAADHRAERDSVRCAARVVALRAAPEWSGPEHITVSRGGRGGGGAARARVAAAPTVLAALAELSEPLPEGGYLVLLTPCGEQELGTSLLGRFVGAKVHTVNSWELLADELGVRMLDPRLHSRAWTWLAEALHELGPDAGWRRGAAVLKLEDALHRVAALRFGREAGERLDAAALLDWTRDPALVRDFTELREAEREGLRQAMEQDVGAVARVVFLLLDKGHVYDTLAIGLVFGELVGADQPDGPAAREARIRAEERFFGGRAPRSDVLDRFAKSAQASLLRMVDGDDHDAALKAIDRAEDILATFKAGEIAAASRILHAGLEARLTALAARIREALPVRGALPEPAPQDLRPVEAALDALGEHSRFPGQAVAGDVALTAVRLLRWLATPVELPRTVAEGVAAHMRSNAWVDTAASLIRTEGGVPPALGEACAVLYERVRARRAEFDEAFAHRIAAWSESAAPPGHLLLAENLLERLARPLSAYAAPLIVVLDGMSAEVAVQLAAEITAGGAFQEIGREDGVREGALAVLPSVTTRSRTSLFAGQLVHGGQSRERSAFTELWHRPSWGPRPAGLFYQSELEAGTGKGLADQVRAALDDAEQVVGVVLNTIDDALATGREGDTAAWRVGDVGKLGLLLAAAARARRPVVLTSDHGHVWDRHESERPVHGEYARYRSGEPGEREVLVTGPRVLAGDGRIVVPWDERVRYTSRKEGYHGGISAAEMVIPALVFVPDPELIPRGWAASRPGRHVPSWWTHPLVTAADPEPPAAPAPATPAKRARPSAPAQDSELFSVADAAGAPAPAPALSLGARVVASPTYQASRAHMPHARPDEEVATVIDVLDRAGGAYPKLPVGYVAEEIGAAPFRAVRLLKAVAKVLNVEMFSVLALTDGEQSVELNRELLGEQFPPGKEAD